MKRSIRCLLAVILIGILICPLTVRAEGENELLALMNASRVQAGLPEYVMNEDLCSAAATRAAECAVRFSHTRPNGQSWNTVSSVTKGENLAHAVNSNQCKAENVALAWMLSPGHKANVLRSTFSQVGIATYYNADTGETYIVCEFN